MHLSVFVSSKCFCQCLGCYSYSREEELGSYLQDKYIIDFLTYAFKNGVNKVTLCGGDPLLRKNILDLIYKIKKIGYIINLDTVGTSIIEKMDDDKRFIPVDVKKLSQLVDMIGIPIDGSNDVIINSFRNYHNNIYREQLKICDILNENEANICINTVIHKKNLDDIDNIIKTINNLNYIKKWQVFQFIPMGKFGNKNKEKFEISAFDFEKVKNKISKNIINKNLTIDFKSIKDRNKLYILVDNSGFCRITSIETENSECYNIIGNIKNKEDWKTICSYLGVKEK